jgi:uncharacterized membrane protein YeaQ/YmgE (transglycosylase-associated protein family)
MSILAWIVVGLIAGWLAERITGRNHGLLTNLVVGIVGAFVGGFLISSLRGFATRKASTCRRSWSPHLELSRCSR